MTDAETPALLSCPFCGGPAVIVPDRLEPRSEDHIYVMCQRCDLYAPVDDGPGKTVSRADQIAAWNRRTPSPDDLRREGAEAERARVVALGEWIAMRGGSIAAFLIEIEHGDRRPATEAGTGEEGKR